MVLSNMPPPRESSSRNPFLRFLFYVYTTYLGVTPPKPEHEKIAAIVLLSSLVLFGAFFFFLMRFIASTFHP